MSNNQQEQTMKTNKTAERSQEPEVSSQKRAGMVSIEKITSPFGASVRTEEHGKNNKWRAVAA